jgi:hypothetical protein
MEVSSENKDLVKSFLVQKQKTCFHKSFIENTHKNVLIEKLASLAIDMVMDYYFKQKTSKDLIRDFIVGIESLRSEIT